MTHMRYNERSSWIHPKNIKNNDIKEGWSQPKTYWYRAEIPEFTVVTIFGHLRREFQISKILTSVLVIAEASNYVYITFWAQKYYI